MANYSSHDLQQLMAFFARSRISQRAIAQHLGVSEVKVSRWWHNHVPIPRQHCIALEGWACSLESAPPSPQPGIILPAAIKQVLSGFVDYLLVERGLSRATKTMYCRDLRHFFTTWQQQGREALIELLTPPVGRECLSARLEQGISPRTIARTLSALKSFDRDLKAEGLRPALTLVDMASP